MGEKNVKEKLRKFWKENNNNLALANLNHILH